MADVRFGAASGFQAQLSHVASGRRTAELDVDWRFIPLGGFMSGYITDIRAIDLDSFQLSWPNIGA
jgi:hypothetical protein